MSDTKLVSLRIPNELLAELDRIAKQEHRSRAQVIVMRLTENPAADRVPWNEYPSGKLRTRTRADHAETCKCLMCKPPKA